MTKKDNPDAQDGPVEIPEILPILPLRNSVLFPGSIIPIDVGRKKSVRLVEEAISKERPVIGILTQRDAATIPVYLSGFSASMGIAWGEYMAVGFFAVAPIMIFTLLLQRHLVRGLTFGAVR